MDKMAFVSLLFLAFIAGCLFGVAIFTAKLIGLKQIVGWLGYYRAHVALYVMNLAWRIRRA